MEEKKENLEGQRKEFVEEVVRQDGKDAFRKNSDEIKGLHEMRVALSKSGYKEDANPKKKEELKECKKWFKKEMQKRMLISLDEQAIEVYNRFDDFVRTYYIGSEKVRVMNIKAHKIIEKLFEFFMENEGLLPESYKRRIAFDAQKLSDPQDCFCDDYKKPAKRSLVIQYFIERVQEKKPELAEKYELYHYEENTSIVLLDLIADFANETVNDETNKEVSAIFSKWQKSINVKAPSLSSPEFIDLCRHIAKARVVADYIATMTERYAEKKFGEINSLSTSWSVSLH